ncbi:hypothetical protein B0H63DRAFT_139883 [Podospora didyma]|uniref:Uncharacterized protein n=1 Tax=Podospora didyma TaxID=330526 RepID=A0AAE0NS60_9PEZI|nr:hypothetical protein B0H63DRAFT_139883 [Podospora didyma]
MKNLGFAALVGAALLQGVAAACCRSNQCLKAIAQAGPVALSDCSDNLVITVTVTPSNAISTRTVTIVEVADATALVTETTTQTASTETLLFTETATITASTQTETVVAEIITVAVTSTSVQEAATVTTTLFNYEGFTLKARATESPLPDYAAAACSDWTKYASACKCAGAEAAITVTVPGSTSTNIVTVTAGNAVTSTLSTVSSTVTEVVSVTATTSSVVIDEIPVTDVITTTQTATVSVTTTVATTSTPVSVATLSCKPKGVNFRVTTPFADGSTRWLNYVGATNIAWQSFSAGSPVATSVWVLDNEGYLQHATNGNTPFIDLSKTGATVIITSKTKAQVDAAVAAGTNGKIKGCIDPSTNLIKLYANGRSNILSCGNLLYISSGTTGSDARSDCVLLTPRGVDQ